MRSLPASLALVAVLVTLVGCDDAGGGDGGSGGGGDGGAGGAGPAGPSSGAAPWWTTSGGGPLRTSEEICAGACACDAECAAESETFVADCVNRFEDDRSAAALAGCTAQYDDYYACFSRRWSCEAPDACDDVAEAFGACVATLCDAATAICGCPECETECRSHDERCISQCIVEAGACYPDDPTFTNCVDTCYGVGSSSSGGAGGGFVGGE